MKMAALCLIIIVALGFVTVFKEQMPGPLEVVGHEIAEGLDSMVRFFKRVIAINRDEVF